jgi:hypothetical protein
VSRLGLRHPVLIFGSLGVLAVVAIVVLVSSGGDSRPDYPFPVQTFEDLGREHLTPGQTYDFYNSDPPTTGPRQRPLNGVSMTSPLRKRFFLTTWSTVVWSSCTTARRERRR